MRPAEVLCPRPEGLYCAPGDFFIDPIRPVHRALITHGHSDHARAGHGHVLATRQFGQGKFLHLYSRRDAVEAILATGPAGA